MRRALSNSLLFSRWSERLGSVCVETMPDEIICLSGNNRSRFMISLMKPSTALRAVQYPGSLVGEVVVSVGAPEQFMLDGEVEHPLRGGTQLRGLFAILCAWLHLDR
jgi:hypothetical protein